MKILVLNCGSSSIKYQLFDMIKTSVLAKGLVDKIGMNGASLTNKREDGDEVRLEGEIIDHQQGIEYVLGVMTSSEHGSINSINEIKAVGHRVVHGAEKFKSSVYINDDVIEQMENCVELAPLHNPPNLKGIYAMKALLPNVPQCGVFDTAFHQTMPDYAYMYALPYSLYKKYGVRRYGFHGSSHRYVSRKAANILNVDYENLKIISCHLGNGASIAAIKNGKSLDTSMGLTPVEGLIMGTRVGDVDAGALSFIMTKEEIGVSQLNTLMNKQSGILGVSGVSSDMREVEKAVEEGNERAALSLKMYTYRIKKYIGAYAAAMGGVDVIIFTGGVGENAIEIRAEILSNLNFMGIELDEEKNKVRAKDTVISTSNSTCKIMLIPTDEELVIAQDTMAILNQMNKK
jgi:acetate kinase